MRIVLDTNVFMAGIRSPRGASAEILRRVLRGEMTMAASVALFLEFEAVATRPEHLAAAQAEREEAVNLLPALASKIEPVTIRFLWRPMLRDPDDEMVLETAVNAGSPIVTFNRRDFQDAAHRFGIDVISPADALMRRR